MRNKLSLLFALALAGLFSACAPDVQYTANTTQRCVDTRTGQVYPAAYCNPTYIRTYPYFGWYTGGYYGMYDDGIGYVYGGNYRRGTVIIHDSHTSSTSISRAGSGFGRSAGIGSSGRSISRGGFGGTARGFSGGAHFGGGFGG